MRDKTQISREIVNNIINGNTSEGMRLLYKHNKKTAVWLTADVQTQLGEMADDIYLKRFWRYISMEVMDNE